MTLKSKFTITTVIAVVISLAVVFADISFSSKLEHQYIKNSTADKVVSGILNLNLLTIECIQSKEPRLLDQWGIKFNRTLKVTEKLDSLYHSQNENVKSIIKRTMNIKKSFERIIPLFHEKTENQNQKFSILYSQMIHNFREISHNSVIIQNNSTNELKRLIRYGIVKDLLIIAFVFLLIIFYGVMLFKWIFKPLSAIREKIYDIGTGNLQAKINMKTDDELGQVARVFDESIEKLDNLTTSKKELEESQNKIIESNKELEKFAYIASHDLQEPLRMVSSFLQLLEQRTSDKLNSDEKEFISFAVDGAKRMQVLIQDLLAYSRISTQGKEFKKVNMNSIMTTLIDLMQVVIKENDADIIYSNLPEVCGDESQVLRLFQNLIGNAIKFKKSDCSPVISIKTEQKNNRIEFRIKDNGIGIDEKYFSKIFVIFQRLHTRDEFSGTGIGLAVCKKIVERHGGTISVESEKNKSTEFIFDLPVA